MALTQVTGPYPIFTDLDGTPLDDGYLYIGDVNQDPEQNPIQVYWDANLTIPATQPIRTNNGYAYRNGTPALIYTAGAFSITIRNKREEFVLYSPVGYGFDPAAVSASVVKNDFVGDGAQVAFVLSASPSTILATNIFINGVYQEKDSYSLSGNTITFSVAPPLNSSIEILTNETGVINAGNATAISYTLTATGAVAQTVQTKLEQYVSVKDFGAVGDGVTDDSVAVQAALTASKNVYFPDGTYLINGAYSPAAGMEMQTGQCLIGQSANAILLQGTIRLMLTAGKNDGGTTNPANNKKNIRISNLTFQNNAGTLDQFKHLVMLSAVSNVIIENCNFIGSQGDGLYIGSGISAPGIERHNENIIVRNCLFDGVNQANRNGISVLDGDGVLIDGCKFTNYSDPTMPGAIDIEPDPGSTFAITKNITVQNCTFDNISGGYGFVFFTPSINLTTPPEKIHFLNNYIASNCTFVGGPVAFLTGQTVTDNTPPMSFQISGNYFGACAGTTAVQAVRGLTVDNNSFDGCLGPVLIGNDASASIGIATDVEISNNVFRNTGNSVAMLVVGLSSRVNIVENTFSKPRTSPYAITFFGSGATTTSSYTTIQRNRFIKNTSTPQTHTVYAASHTFSDPTTNRWFDNTADATLDNSFQFSYEETRFTAFHQNADATSVLSVLPDAYPLGQYWNIVNGDTSAPDAYDQGIVETRKYNSDTAFRKFIVQTYYPANTTVTELKDMYWRKGVAASNTWSAWVKVTGV